jgi:transcriptional regulator with XRE-family HTH domain
VRRNETEINISPERCRAARLLLGWSRDKLAGVSGISASSIARLETGTGRLHISIPSTIQRVLENAGVEFIVEGGGGRGVRLRKAK